MAAPEPIPPRDEWPDTGFLDMGGGKREEVELFDIESRLKPEDLAHVIVDFGDGLGEVRPWRFAGGSDAEVRVNEDGTTSVLI